MNRRRFLAAFDSEYNLATAWQVHGDGIKLVDSQADIDDSESRFDGLVSRMPGVLVGVKTADCVPVLIGDTGKRAFAAIHAGWRGTCARIASTAVETMRCEFGSDPSDMIAAIGPSVGPDDYEVGDALIDAFLDAGHSRRDVDRWFIRTYAKPHLDLWTANRDQLTAAGLGADTIYLCRLSTVSNAGIFDSYRVAGERVRR